jgi:hypothetical protein
VGAQAGQFIVIAFHRGAIEIADDVEALLGVGIVADDVSEADMVRALMGLRVRQDCLKAL